MKKLKNNETQTPHSNYIQFNNISIDENIFKFFNNDDDKFVNALKNIKFVGTTKNNDTIFIIKNDNNDEILISLLYNMNNTLNIYDGEYISYEESLTNSKKSLYDDLNILIDEISIVEEKIKENNQSMKLILDDDMVNTVQKYITKIKKSTYDKEQESKILENKRNNFEKAIEVDIIDI